MDETRDTLVKCFSAIFPSLSKDEILEADATNTEAWDSVASVTLFAAIEEEFGIEMDVQDSAALLSFAGVLGYLRTRMGQRTTQ